VGLTTFKKYFTVRRVVILFFLCIITAIILGVLLQNKDFRNITVNKIFGDGNYVSNPSQLSKADRINSINTAIFIGINNPFIGVGLSNYALHYKRYNQNEIFKYENNKVIPNNVYAELFSETGLLGFLLFMCFLFSLYKRTALDPTYTLRFGFIALLIGLIAFPSVTVLFLWVFWGLIISLPKSQENHE
jgi:O-antigen ligase